MDEKIVMKNKQVTLKNFVDGIPKESDMEVRVSEIELNPPSGYGGIVVKNLYLSCDPYMRGRMRNFHGSYIPPFVPGQALEGFGVAKVVNSDHQDFERGDIVTGMTGWEEYSLILRTEQLKKIHLDDQIPLSFHLGLLGMPGLTAYAGFFEVCSPKKGEQVFISAASGAVGQLVGQLAKLHGCRVVGSAGSSHKVDLLKNKLGFDDAFNYKEEPDLDGALKRHFPEGIDIYFDNVGGDMLDAALGNMRVFGRIAGCGVISMNGLSDPQAMRNLFHIVIKRIRFQGFVQSDYSDLLPQFTQHVASLYKRGEIVYIEDVSQGLDTAPSSLAGLFSGKNVGKQVICVATQ